jgi:SAM-dependent methyltransferase
MSQPVTDDRIKEAVRSAYGDIARSFVETDGPPPAPCCGPSKAMDDKKEQPAQSSCCEPAGATTGSTAAAQFYSVEELTDLPETVTDASLGCGNPLAIADLRPGEVVLDLGSGGGIDCFLAARKVGPTGRVIGLDMTPDMIKLARRNAKKIGATNVDFRFGEMEDMPLPAESVDVVISNCVVNLSPDKDAVFREAFRVLRPGGCLSISDMVVAGDLPEFLRNRLDAWAGCIAGALDESIYLDKIRAAGFEDVQVLSRDHSEIDEGTDWDQLQVIIAGEDGRKAKELLAESGLTPRDMVRKVASIKVHARKPEGNAS